MMIRTTLALAVLAGAAVAQKDQPADAEAMFYRAFYLERGERRAGAALELYTKFLEASPSHKYAGRAARSAFAILDRADRKDEAAELKAKFASHFGAAAKKKDSADRDKASDRPVETTAAKIDRDANALSDEERAKLKDSIADLAKRLEAAEKDGDDRTARRLARQVERAERQLETGVRSERSDREQGDRRPRMDFAKMSDEEITEGLQRMERRRDRMLGMLRERGESERVEALEKQWKAMKKALDDGKKGKAQEILDELMQSMRRRR